MVNGRGGFDFEKLRRIVKALEKRVAALEESARIALGTLSKPAIVDSTPLNREQLVERLTRWRSENGIEGPNRYLKNRSTAQLRKMLAQINEGSVYRLGRRWKKLGEVGNRELAARSADNFQ